MRTHHKFVEGEDGIHVSVDDDRTLCGCSLASVRQYPRADGEGTQWQGELYETDRRTVTCPMCISVISSCRGIRTWILARELS